MRQTLSLQSYAFLFTIRPFLLFIEPFLCLTQVSHVFDVLSVNEIRENKEITCPFSPMRC